MTNADVIFVKNLLCETQIGLLDWEKEVRQTLTFNITVWFNFKKASKSDAINDTVNYASLSQCIIDYCAQADFELIESLGEHICEHIFSKWPLEKIELSIEKSAIVPGTQTVGIKLIREPS